MAHVAVPIGYFSLVRAGAGTLGLCLSSPPASFAILPGPSSDDMAPKEFPDDIGQMILMEFV